MTNAKARVAARLFHGNNTVNPRSADKHTLYEDLCDLLRDYESLQRALAHLTDMVVREPTQILSEDERRAIVARSRSL